MRNFLKNGTMAVAILTGLGTVPGWADNLVLWVNAPLASGPDAPLYAELKKFEAETGNKVEVQAVPHMEMERNLFVAMSGGAGPDVMALDIAWVAGLADAGLLMDITEQSAPLASKYQPGPFAGGRYEGKQYALPLYTNNAALIVNDKMLAQAGIDKAPTTWEELRAAAVAMTNAEKGTYGISFGSNRMGAFQLYPFIWQAGGEIIDDKGKSHVADPEAIGAVDFLAKLYTQDKAMPESVLTAGNWDEVHAPFIQERAGMVISGDWAIAAIKKNAPNLAFSIHPLPQGKKAATVIGGYNLAVRQGTAAPKAAFQLVEWLTGDRSIELMGKYQRLSATAAATTPEAIAKLPKEMQPFMAQASAGHPRPVVASWSEMHGVFGNMWDAVIRGKPAAEALAEANAEVENLLAK